MATGSFMRQVARARRNTSLDATRRGAPSTATASKRTSKAQREPAPAWRAALVRCNLRSSKQCCAIRPCKAPGARNHSPDIGDAVACGMRKQHRVMAHSREIVRAAALLENKCANFRSYADFVFGLEGLLKIAPAANGKNR